MTSVRVIGAGLSGLATAWCLVQRGVEVEVVEAASGPGGLIQTRSSPYGLVETAANAFVWTPTVERWFADLQLTPCFALPASRARYLWRSGRPRQWPLSVGETGMMAARWGSRALTRATSPRSGETVRHWADRVFGPAATRWLIGPALQGIYAAGPENLSATLVIGGRRRGRRVMAAPEGGMAQFVDRLHARLVDRGVSFRFGQAVSAVDPGMPTVVATSAPAAAQLVSASAARLASALAGVRQLPLTSVTAFFRSHDADAHGFGVLFPREGDVQALGVLFNTDIFRHRGPGRSETWIYGGVRDAGNVPSMEAVMVTDRARLTGRQEDPLEAWVTARPQAIPCYDGAITTVRAALAARPANLALAGNYLGQIGVSAILEQAAAWAASSVQRS